MAALILSHVTCKIRAVIRFLHAQKQSPAEIHRPLCHLYEPDIMSDRMVRRWGKSLKVELLCTTKTVVADRPW